jgi:hypothetical protein
MLKSNRIVLYLVINVLRLFKALLDNSTKQAPSVTSHCCAVGTFDLNRASSCWQCEAGPGSRLWTGFLLCSLVFPPLTHDDVAHNQSSSQSTNSSCADAYPFVQGWQPTVRGNISLDTPKPINTGMKTSVGSTWRIACVSTQEALVSEDLLMLKLELWLSRIVYSGMVHEERKLILRRFPVVLNVF